MYKRLAVLSTALFLLSSNSPAEAEEAFTPSFRAAVKELLTLQNAPSVVGEQMTFEMANQILQSIAVTGTQVTGPMQQIVLDAAREEFGPTYGDVEILTDLYVPIYAKHYSEEELRKMSAFWKSPVGKKMIELMPMLTQETYSVLQQNGLTRLPAFQKTVDARLRQAGIVVPGPPQP